MTTAKKEGELDSSLYTYFDGPGMNPADFVVATAWDEVPSQLSHMPGTSEFNIVNTVRTDKGGISEQKCNQTTKL